MTTERVTGRKRTIDGTLIEVRVHGEDPEALTVYAQTLIDAADLVCVELRQRRAAIRRLALERRALPCPTCEGERSHDPKCPELLAQLAELAGRAS